MEIYIFCFSEFSQTLEVLFLIPCTFSTLYNMSKPAVIPRWLSQEMPSSLYSHPFLSDTFSDIFVIVHAFHATFRIFYATQFKYQRFHVSCYSEIIFFQGYLKLNCHFPVFHYWLFLLPLRFKCQSAVKFSTKKMALSELQICPAVFFHIRLHVIQLPLTPH